MKFSASELKRLRFYDTPNQRPIIVLDGVDHNLYSIDELNPSKLEFIVAISGDSSAPRIHKNIPKETLIEVDINNPRNLFRGLYIWEVFGSSKTLRHEDWSARRCGSLLGKNSILDNTEGFVDFHNSDFFYFHDEDFAASKETLEKSKIQAFLEDPTSKISCGFELETQRTDGIQANEYGDHLNERLVEVKFNRGASHMTPWIRSDIEDSSPDFKKAALLSSCEFKDWLTTNGGSNWDSLVEAGHLTAKSLEVIKLRYVGDMEVIDDYDYDEDGTSLSGSRELWDLPSEIEVVTDGSVDGFEFRTVGGRSMEEFKTLLDKVTSIDHTVDTRCSFHIHIKVEDISHKYNRAFEQAIIEYLFEHVEDLPEVVRERWANPKANYFFTPDKGREKMSFLNFHPTHKTLEFRCFGNVSSTEDGMKCLQCALNALVYVYSKNEMFAVTSGEWRTKAKECMETNNPENLKAFAEAHRLHSELSRERIDTLRKLQPELAKLKAPSFNYKSSSPAIPRPICEDCDESLCECDNPYDEPCECDGLW